MLILLGGKVRKIGIPFFIVLAGLLTVGVLVICLVSIWIGVQRFPYSGYWAPMAAGGGVAVIVFMVFIRINNLLLNWIKEDESMTV